MAHVDNDGIIYPQPPRTKLANALVKTLCEGKVIELSLGDDDPETFFVVEVTDGQYAEVRIALRPIKGFIAGQIVGAG